MIMGLEKFIGKFTGKSAKGFLKRLSDIMLPAILICSVFLLNCEVAWADTFNPDDYKDYVLMSESDAVKAYNNYIETMTPEGAELRIYCNAQVNDALKYKNYSVYFDSYMKFAYQAANEYVQVSRTVDGHKTYCTYYRYYCALREVHSSMTAGEYSQAVNKAKQIAGSNNYGSDYDKIKRVYKWICDNVEYDYFYEDGSIYDALIGGKSVCSGYAGAFQVIMDAMGIECYINEGKAAGEDHAWNIVKLDGKYYFVDATWGDTSTEYDKYLLFGTDLRDRDNFAGLALASSSYSAPGVPAETTGSGGSQETQTTAKPVEKETIVAKPVEKPTTGSGNAENVEVADGDNDGKGGTDKPENETPKGNGIWGNPAENVTDSSTGSVTDNKLEKQTNNQSENQTEKMTSIDEGSKKKGQGNGVLIAILSATGVLFAAGAAFIYIKFIKK